MNESKKGRSGTNSQVDNLNVKVVTSRGTWPLELPLLFVPCVCVCVARGMCEEVCAVMVSLVSSRPVLL